MATEPTAQPKITQRLLLRTLILLVLLGVLFVGYRFFETQKNDFNFGSSSAAGLIAALQKTEDGTEAVLIHPDGTIKGTDSYHPGASDRDIVWRPDGKFLFFTSDRTGNTYHVYRWNPDQSDAEARTVGNRSRTNPTFPADDVADANDDMIIVSGGAIEGFDQKTKQTPQLLPPSTSTITSSTAEDQQGGSEALFSAMYGNLGTSFSYGRWCKGNRYIAAIMKRDAGEVLILQDMTPKNGKLLAPLPVVAGDHVVFDVNPKDGSLIYAVQNFQWPDPEKVPESYKKGNKITVPLKHLVGIVDPDKPTPAPIVASKDDKNSFGSPSISPDGSKVVITTGIYDPSTQSLQPKALITMPAQAGGAQAASPLVQGEVYEPSWSKDGALVAFAMRANGKRDIYTIHQDGTSQVNLTGGKGDFSFPKFNPQQKG